MELKAHFFNIHKVIINHLETAQSEIVAAVAWFTDRDIFEVLCQKARSGTKVSVALIGDKTNQGPGGLNFQRLRNVGGQVTFLPPGTRDEPTMHHKFCVIDRSIVITGSYNWSKKARSNDENITVVSDSSDFAGKYLETFESLLIRVGQNAPIAADSDAVRRRLEMIRNLILLGEQDDVAPHLQKLRLVAGALRLDRIIASLDNGEYRVALEEIDAHLSKATAMVTAEFDDILRLRLMLMSLELRLESLTDEKAELERRLITFNRRHDYALGDLIQRILKARSELAWRRASLSKDPKDHEKAEATARDAERAFNEYASQHAELRIATPLPRLDDEGEQELRAIYRKACSLCHPDKVPEGRKDAAHRAFVELQEAYKRSDLPTVQKIHETLKAGGSPETRSNTLGESESLRAAIAELEFTLTELIVDLRVLHESEAFKLVSAAGDTELQWQRYFDQQKVTLETELAAIKLNLVNL